MSIRIEEIKVDAKKMDIILDVFEEGFEDSENYGRKTRPSVEYLKKLLRSETFFPLLATIDGKPAGALAAYELQKFEKERSEIYIYDLAVLEKYRRQGVATALIEHLKNIARERGAWVIFVQADTTPDDEAAIALYEKLGVREEVLHFDIQVTPCLSDKTRQRRRDEEPN